MNRHVHDGPTVFQLPNTEPVTGLITLENEGLLAFQAKQCHVLRVPKEVDPEGTNPNAPAVLEPLPIGSEDPLVSRLLMQPAELLRDGQCEVHVEHVSQLCYELVRDLLECRSALDALQERLAFAQQRHEEVANAAQQGQHVLVAPQIETLRGIATQFLVHARRAINTLCTLTADLANVKKHNNFEKMHESLSDSNLANEPFAATCQLAILTGKHIMGLRNAQEHPDGDNLRIENCRIGPHGELRPPTWRVDGAKPIAAQDISTDMRNSFSFLVRTAEVLLVHLIMHRRNKKLPQRLEDIPADQRDAANPVRFRLRPHLGRE